MATVVPITAVEDDRLSDYVRLRDASLRKHVETQRGLFIAEGDKIIARALAAGLTPRSLMLAPRWLEPLLPLLARHDVEIYLVSEELAEAVTGFHVHRGALGAFHRPIPIPADSLLGSQRLVVLEDIVDHTNVGACFRSVAGLGWDGVLISPRCADPLYRRSIKVSMGAVLEVPWARVDSWETTVGWLQRAGFTVAALALAQDAITLDDFAAQTREHPGPVAVLLGSEGHGLSSAWMSQADRIVTIPMLNGIDSLNVAAASAVACYVLRP